MPGLFAATGAAALSSSLHDVQKQLSNLSCHCEPKAVAIPPNLGLLRATPARNHKSPSIRFIRQSVSSSPKP